MALEIPSELEPFFQVYGIPWPDVDEDVFKELPGPLRNFGADLLAVGDAIESALQDLAAGNPSHTLQAIQEYIARDSVRYAEELVDRLVSAVERLRDFPASGRLVPELEGTGLREIILGNYRIVYRILRAGDVVEIITVYHAQRRLRPDQPELQ